MGEWWAVEKLAEAHRQDLMASARPRKAPKPARQVSLPAPSIEATQRATTGLPVSGGRVVRRPIGNRIGTWLIHAGTRLGGASIRTS